MSRETGDAPPSVLLVGPDPAMRGWIPAAAGERPARVVVVDSLAEADAALRDPLDLVVAWDDRRGRRAREVAALLERARCPLPRLAVAHPEAPAGPDDGPDWPVLEPARSHLLEAELRRARAAADVAMRAALAERIAHDLSNLLAPIPLALQLLRSPDPAGRGAPRSLGPVDAVATATRRAMTTVKELSALLTAVEGEPVRVGAKHLLILAARAWPEGGVLTEYPPDLGRVRMRPVRIARVLWCCARRELDRIGADAPGAEGGDLLFTGRNLAGEGSGDGEVELRVRWQGVAGDGAAGPVEARAAAPAGPDADALRAAVEEEGGTLERLVSAGGGPAGFRLRLPGAG